MYVKCTETSPDQASGSFLPRFPKAQCSSLRVTGGQETITGLRCLWGGFLNIKNLKGHVPVYTERLVVLRHRVVLGFLKSFY